MIWNKNPTEIVQHNVNKKTLLSVDRWWKKDGDVCRMCGTFYKFNSTFYSFNLTFCNFNSTFYNFNSTFATLI